MNAEEYLAKSIGKVVDAKIKKAMSGGPSTMQAVVTGTDSQGKTWVRLPGAENNTPVKRSAAETEVGDVVSVTISNGRAIIDSNISNPAAGAKRVDTINRQTIENRNTTENLTLNVQGIAADVAVTQGAAMEALTQAQNASEAADTAWAYADDAHVAAQTAWKHADDAADAASAAQMSADNAQVSANEAKAQATRATTYANDALVQLGTVEDVIGVVNWVTEHGTYSLTEDAHVDPSKVYYTRTGSGTSSDPYLYTAVPEPEDAGLPGYYELSIDQALSQYVASHLALTDNGLYVLKDGSSWKTLTKNSGFEIQDPQGHAVMALSGAGISYNADYPQYIGNNDAYILFTPAQGTQPASITIGGGNVIIGSNKKLSDVLTSLDVSVTQTATGADITVNGDTVSIADGSDGSQIWTATADPTTPNYTFAISALSGGTGTPRVGDIVVRSYYRYTVTSVASTTVLTGTRTSIRGAQGEAGHSPAVTTTKNSDGSVTIYVDGTATSTVDAGQDGSTPSITTVKNADGSVTIYVDGTASNTVEAGADGTSYYTYVRYSANSSGSGMVVTPTSATKYIGVYTGTSSSVPAYTSFKWSKYVGEDGDDADPLTVTAQAIDYQLSTSGTDAPTGTWSATPLAPTTTQFLWTRTTLTFSDGTSMTSYSVGGKTGTNGASAYSYDLLCSPAAIVKAEDGTLAPSSVTFSSTRLQGTGSPSAYAGRFKIEEHDGSSWSTKYTSSANESSKAYSPTSTAVLVRCTLYLAGGTTTQLDTQTVPIVSDGPTGPKGGTGGTGPAGADAYTVVLTNESHTFPAGTGAATASSTECQVIAYKGATQVAATIGTISGQVTGLTTSISNNGTTSAKFTATAATTLTTKSGTLTVPVTVDGKSFTKKFTWALSLTGAKGDKGDQGDQGVSVTNVTSTNSTADGGTSVVTVTLSDGTTKTFNVKNGSKGSTGPTAQWYFGTALTHTSGTATLATSTTSGVVVGCMYLNSNTSLCYRCTAISGTTATWTYAGDLTTGVLENLEIGGRNLVLGTGAEYTRAASAVAAGGYAAFDLYDMVDVYSSLGLVEGEYLSVSCDVTLTGAVANTTLKIGTNVSPWEYFGVVATFGAGTSTKHIEAKFAITSALASCAGAKFRFRIDCPTAASALGVKAKNVKLERGNKATDWTPAPEDFEASSIEYIEGTQTAATGTWTGNTRESSLVAGKMIAYRLPYAGSGTATLNLHMGNGTGEWTGAKNVQFNSNNSAANNVTTHFGAGSIIHMTYDGTVWRVAAGYYDTGGISNARYRTQNPNAIKAATAITASRIICGDSSGYKNIGAGVAFDLAYPLLYATAAITAGSTGTGNYLTYNGINAANNGTVQGGTVNKMLFLKGTVIGNAFTIASSNFLTCTVPASADGFAYIPLGIVYSVSSGTFIYFATSKELWCYKDGAFGPVSLREASQAAKTATNYITKQGSGDTWIHAEGLGPDSSNNPTSTTRGWRIGEAFDLFRGTVSHFKVWVEDSIAKVRVGAESSGHSIFSPDGMEVFKDASTSVAKFAASARIGEEDGVKTVIESGSFKIVDPNNILVTWIKSDNSGEDGVASISLSCVGDGSTKTFTAVHSVKAITSCQYDDGSSLATPSFSDRTFTFSSAPTKAFTIKYTTNDSSFTMTLGTRKSSYSHGVGSLAFGALNAAAKQYTAAIGYNNTVDAAYGVAIGRDNIVLARNSTAIGRDLLIIDENETVVGRWNEIPDTSSAFVVGNGVSDDDRKNAYVVEWDGDTVQRGSIYYQGTNSKGRMIRFMDNTSGTDGNGVAIGAGGLAVLGAGESADHLITALSLAANAEDAYVSADGKVCIVPNCNTIANRKIFTFTTNGGLTLPDGGAITNPGSLEFKPSSSSANNGGYVDFHYNQSTADFTSRIIESASGKLNLIASNGVQFNGGALPVANGGTGATDAAKARTNLGITPANIGAATSSHTHESVIAPTRANTTTANTSKDTTRMMRHLLATSSMTEGKPMGDGHIIDLAWDNNGGWGGQIYVPNTSSGHLQFRGENGGTWTTWRTVLDDTSINAITAKISAALTLATAEANIALASDVNVGSGFSIVSGGVKCAVAGTVSVTALVYFSGVTDQDQCNCSIKKGSTQVSHATARSSGNANSVTLAEKLVTVAAGDVLYLSAGNGNAARGTVPAYASMTYMTVKYI